MAKKVTVSIPDMLHEKMERWRRSFNLSKMFQEAVSEAIRKKEEFHRRLQQDIDLAEVIERLRREKALAEGKFHDSGRQDGIRWAKSASYDDILYALSWQEHDSALADPILGAFFREKIDANTFMSSADGRINDYGLVYIRGWKKGLADFWEAVRDKL